jgi:hypothetical protein
MSNSRALEMFQNDQGVDCVIEVVPQIDGQEKQVIFIGALLLVVPLHSVTKIPTLENIKMSQSE